MLVVEPMLGHASKLFVVLVIALQSIGSGSFRVYHQVHGVQLFCLCGCTVVLLEIVRFQDPV